MASSARLSWGTIASLDQGAETAAKRTALEAPRVSPVRPRQPAPF